MAGLGLDEGSLGRLLELPRRDIVRYTSGERRPSLRRVAEIAAHLGIEPTALMDLPAEPSMESLRESRLVERSDAAVAAGVDLATLQRLEYGQSVFKEDEAQRLADVYGTDLSIVTGAIATSHKLYQATAKEDRVQSVRLRLPTSIVERLDEVRGSESRVDWVIDAILRARPK